MSERRPGNKASLNIRRKFRLRKSSGRRINIPRDMKREFSHHNHSRKNMEEKFISHLHLDEKSMRGIQSA
jgi:hypothetical protein